MQNSIPARSWRMLSSLACSGRLPRDPIATGGPVLGFDLPRVLWQLRHERTSSGNRTAMTLVKHRDFRLVLVVMKPGACVARHHVRGTVLIQVLSGKIRIGILGEHLGSQRWPGYLA